MKFSTTPSCVTRCIPRTTLHEIRFTAPSYDPVGNRTTGGSVVNAGNQLTADANFSYQYDDNGNLTRKTITATANFTQYTYDAENRLTKVEEFTVGNPTPVATSTYRYDGLGRRIEKMGNGQTRRYVYDGEDIFLEYDQTNTLLARYTHGPGIDEPIAVTKAGSTFFYHQDGLGTVTELTDSTGTTAKAYAYDAYGNILDQPGTVDQPYTYTGREFDAETGLYYYRARYYDPIIGRFLQKDPIGFAGRSLNLYSYVNSNSTNRIDPIGLEPESFNTPTAAARNITKTYNPQSIISNLEYCGMICKVCPGTYIATGPVIGTQAGCDPQKASCPSGSQAVAFWHTHGAVTDRNGDGKDDYDSENFSTTGGDTDYANYYGMDGYLGTPSGQLKQYNQKAGQINNLGPLY